MNLLNILLVVMFNFYIPRTLPEPFKVPYRHLVLKLFLLCFG